VSTRWIGERNPSATFTVDTVSHATITYDPSANSDPDGDSDGTSITVNRPRSRDEARRANNGRQVQSLSSFESSAAATPQEQRHETNSDEN
jgi:hypothetical protein